MFNTSSLPTEVRNAAPHDAPLAALPRYGCLLHGIREALAAPAAPHARMESIGRLLDGFATDGLAALLQRLSSDAAGAAAVAQRSYHHANGFYKIVLAADAAFKLRLHIWFAGSDAEENIHDHRWWFASRVLHGELHSELYEECAGAQGREYDEYLYLGRRGDAPPQKQLLGRTRLCRAAQGVRRAGEGYVLKPGVLHRITGIGAAPATATLLCQAAPARDWNRLLPARDIEPDLTQRFLTGPALLGVLARYQEAVS